MKRTGRVLTACIGLLAMLSGCIAVKEVSVTQPRYQAVSADGKLYLVDTHRREAYPVLVRHAEQDDDDADGGPRPSDD